MSCILCLFVLSFLSKDYLLKSNIENKFVVEFHNKRRTNMKKISVLFFFVIVSFAIFAQSPDFVAPNYNEIEKNIQNEFSNLYYPKLMERYIAGDSTFTADEQRHLYYGYVFQPTYKPTEISEYNGKMSDLLAKQYLDESDYDLVLVYADELLKEDPFNLRALNAKLLIYAQKNDVDAYKNILQRRRNVQLAIINSGDGMSKSTPYYVIRVSHEYDMLGFLGFQFGGTDKLVKRSKCNYLSLATNRFGIDKLYFNIAPVFKYASKHGVGKL